MNTVLKIQEHQDSAFDNVTLLVQSFQSFWPAYHCVGFSADLDPDPDAVF